MKLEVGNKIKVSSVFPHYPHQGIDTIVRVTDTIAFGKNFAYRRDFEINEYGIARIDFRGGNKFYSAYLDKDAIEAVKYTLPKEYQD